MEEGRVKSLRAMFEKGPAKPISPVEFEKTRASVARHNLKFAARRASRTVKPGPYTTALSNLNQQRQLKKIESTAFDNTDTFWLPELDNALSDGDERGVNAAVLKFFFEEHDPSRVNEIDGLLSSNQGREEAFFLELSTQYPEPAIDVAFALMSAERKEEEAKNWAKFDDEPILSGIRRPTGVWVIHYSPWDK